MTKEKKAMVQNSRIFQKNRALGYVSNHIPLVTRYIRRRKENLIVTCIGKEFHTYGCAHFTLLSVSGAHPNDITCLAADTYHIYTACDNDVYAWRRGTELKHSYKGHKHSVHSILPFGPHLLSVDEISSVKVWDIKSEEQLSEINFANSVFKITTLMHPNAYVNKVLFGSEQGQLQLWNIRISKLVYTFQGWKTAVTTLVQAPATDVVAVGLNDGRIVIHNIKVDESIFELIQDWGAVTSISFRMDGLPIMATGSTEGHIVFWNLEKRKVESQLRSAHYDTISGMTYLPNEPLMVTSSPDNSLKLWIFDLADGAGRLLRIREGHAEPPTIARFYGNDGIRILTAGGDSSLRVFSTVSEIANKSLGRASFNRKATKKKGRSVEDPLIMPPITDISVATTREKEWDNIVACHSGLATVTTWSSDRLKMGVLKLLPQRLRGNNNVTVTSLCLTKCGNFVVIGYNNGHVDRFNVQSGIHRATYGDDNSGAHKGPVNGLTVDSLNQTVVTAGRDGAVKFWDFRLKKGVAEPKGKLILSESVEWLRYQNDSSLVAIALEDFSIIVIDLDTRRIVRRFQGHEGRLTDATFNPDSRWLVTASMDCTIRVWDIPSSNLIDAFQVPDACTSLHFSPTGDFLATTHVCNLGVHLWSNRTLYTHISLKALSENDVVPTMGLHGGGAVANGKEEIESSNGLLSKESDYVSTAQLDDDLISTSALASSRWQNLLNIDVVKRRNKPKVAAKVPESAPFFLPTIPSLELQFDLTDNKRTMENVENLRVHSAVRSLTSFGKLLATASTTDAHSAVMEKLKAMGPSIVDFEIQSLSADLSNSATMLRRFMETICYAIDSRKDFELTQSYLAVFLKWHATAIFENASLREYLNDIEKVQLNHWYVLREKLFYNLSVVQALKKM